MVRRDFDGGGTHALGEQTLGIGRDRLIAIGDQVLYAGYCPTGETEDTSAHWEQEARHNTTSLSVPHDVD